MVSHKNCPVAFMLISMLISLEITKDSFEKLRFSRIFLNFDPVEAEIFEVKDTRGHYEK